jgi:hypothetical protein
MEKLISQEVPTSLTIYLQPTILTPRESEWFEFIARIAQSSGEQQEQAADAAVGQRRVDPAASLAGRLFMANYRRLTDKPFLICVHCAAAASHAQAARSVAGTIESIVYEPPFDRPQQDDNRLPSAAEVLGSGLNCDSTTVEQIQRQASNLRFNSWSPDSPFERLPYLADARGAATTFRLPVNVKGGVPGVAVRQRVPDFHPGPRSEAVEPDEIILGGLHQGGLAKVLLRHLCKHTLITGFTGSGKTVTVLGILHQLQEKKIPILVIESAKHEYRGLIGVPTFSSPTSPLWVFTVGNEIAAPLRMNPFELLPGIRVEAHISRLQTCFEAALPPIGPLSSMIGQALFEIYERRGWRLTDIAPNVGDIMDLCFPDMWDFYERMASIIEERGYEGEVRSNVKAAVIGRIKPLTMGSKGLLFRGGTKHRLCEARSKSLLSDLFSRSAIVELNDLNIDDKALVVMFLLTFLREYRESNACTDGDLVHVTVVEEAHNVLENVMSVGVSEGGAADTRYKAVQAFSNLLTEIRAFGEGLIIVDQSPEKLAPDAMRNTNIQIAHQLRDSSDRDAVARAMIMDNEQRDFLGKLLPGQAAVYMTGLQKATFITVPNYLSRKQSKRKPTTGVTNFPDGIGYRRFEDCEVRDAMMPVISSYISGPFDLACQPCSVRASCPYRRPVLHRIVQTAGQSRFNVLVDPYRRGQNGVDKRGTVVAVLSLCQELATLTMDPPGFDLIYCNFVHLWHGDPFNWSEDFPQGFHEIVRGYFDSPDRFMHRGFGSGSGSRH